MMPAQTRFQRLPVVPATRIALWRLGAIACALLMTAGILALSGYSPVDLAWLVVRSTIGSRFGMEDLALFMSPLLLTGAAVGLFVPAPAIVLLPLMAVAGIAAGMGWIAIPTLARAYAGVNEIITTLLLNFVASLLTYYLTTGPWRDRVTGAQVSSARLPVSIPEFWGVVHWGFPLGLVIVEILAWTMAHTRWGYEIRIGGANPDAARYAGIAVRARIIAVMLLSGGLAGLAGMFELAGTVHRLQGGMANNFGYLGIVVAVLARGSCLNVIPAALLMAFILDAGIVLQTQQLTASVVLAITGLMLFMIALADELAHYRPVASLAKGAKP